MKNSNANILKGGKVDGVIGGFTPLSSPENLRNGDSQTIIINDEKDNKPSKKEMILLLLSLSDSDREEVVRSACHDEISRAVSSISIEKIEAQKEIFKNQVNDKVCELESSHKQTIEELHKEIEIWRISILEKSNVVSFDYDSSIFVDLVLRILGDLIVVEVTDKKYLEKLIKKLTSQYEESKPKKITISKFQYDLLKEWDQFEFLSENMLIECSESFEIGDFKLSFQSGSIEYSLVDAVKALEHSFREDELHNAGEASDVG